MALSQNYNGLVIRPGEILLAAGVYIHMVTWSWEGFLFFFPLDTDSRLLTSGVEARVLGVLARGSLNLYLYSLPRIRPAWKGLAAL